MEIRSLGKKTLALIIAAVMFCSLFSTINVFAVQDNTQKHVPGRLLVKFKDYVPQYTQQDILNSQHAKVVDNIPEIGVMVLNVPENSLNGIQQSLSKNFNVEFVEPDSIIEPQTIPNDVDFSNEWHLTKIGAPNAWNVTIGISNVVIAVLDTGFDSTHPDLSGKFVGGYNAYDNSNDWSSAPCGHGTLVAGVAAASTNNGIGIAGLGWQNDILPIKVTGSNCLTTSSVLAKAITYASDHGAKVANISFGIYAGDRTITTAAKYMYNHGGWVVAAAGNSGALVNSNDNRYIISVSATDQNDVIASFSSFGNYVDFAAPGASIYTTCTCKSTITNSSGTFTIPEYYMYAYGTSFSSPIVASLIALIFSDHPNYSPQQVYDVLKQSSVDLGITGHDPYFGWGRIDAGKALTMSS